MSVTWEFYLGPYAECRVPGADCAGDLFEKYDGVFQFNWGLGEPPSVVVDGVTLLRLCVMPSDWGPRDGAPGRPLSFSDRANLLESIIDLQDLDRDAELRWFLDAYRAELEDLAGSFGRAYEAHWGMVVTVR